MNSVIRALVIYLIMMVLIRMTGKRTLAQISTFDFVLVLIIGQATQLGLIGQDYSLVNVLVLVSTLVGVHLALSRLESRFPTAARVLDGVPLLIVENGHLIEERVNRAGVSKEDILDQARSSQGLERMEQIRYAILERDGSISIIPKKE
ncbi:DUF421 domain-containing protein [Archangium violaceum]|uniref:DUF421 domain-containing protein n=1 Tax=Archangium violaceum TaxID=83451 RepID=UPI00193B3A03|nr:YetF domain-containing protein [Archangium violaceum]QRK08453.1 DUF421 domain-containing protein [Archangium violaceum]